MSSDNNEELLKEMSATRKVVALCLQRLEAIEEKVDSITIITNYRDRLWVEEKVRRREATWR